MRIPELTWPKDHANQPYDDDLLLSIDAGRVSLLIRGRNAWHSTWVRHYLRNATLYTDVPSAKAAAELQRGQGNVFYIVEAPAIQLRGTKSNIVLCDSHPDNPFGAFNGFGRPVHQSRYGNWIDGIFPGVSVRDAVEAFVHDSGLWNGPARSEASLRVGRLPVVVGLEKSSRKLHALMSYAMGVNYNLGWRPYEIEARYVHTGARAVAARWLETLDSASFANFDLVELPRLLRRYREDTLQAQPSSGWKRARNQIIQQREAERAVIREELLDKAAFVQGLREALISAEMSLSKAKYERWHPADSTEGIRAQRKRLEEAMARVEQVKSEVSAAEAEVDALHKTYFQLLRLHRNSVYTAASPGIDPDSVNDA